MQALLATVGFFGQQGFLWVILGLICLLIVCVLLFKIVFLLMAALKVQEPWISLTYWILVLLCFLWFISTAFGIRF